MAYGLKSRTDSAMQRVILRNADPCNKMRMLRCLYTFNPGKRILINYKCVCLHTIAYFCTLILSKQIEELTWQNQISKSSILCESLIYIRINVFYNVSKYHTI